MKETYVVPTRRSWPIWWTIRVQSVSSCRWSYVRGRDVFRLCFLCHKIMCICN